MNRKILIVEYDIKTIDMIKETLPYPSIQFEIVEDGIKAKEILKTKEFDMVIAAAMLPKFHGFQLSEFISKNYPSVNIIIISGIYKGLDYKRQAISQYKADDFFEKPLVKDLFQKRLVELLDLDLDEMESISQTAQKSLIDTAKVPTLEQLKEEEVKLTSDDIFGAIIKDVEKSKTEEEILPSSPSTPAPSLKRTPLEKEALMKKALNSQLIKKKNTNLSETRKIDLKDIANMVKKPEREKIVKKIEDDISKKLEDTLSGLGLNSKPVKKNTVKKTDNTVQTEQKKETGKTEEKYDILGLIARGGMAEIYKAKKKGVKGFKKIIALKKILSGYGEDDKFIEMFVDEARIASELSHPNIVQIYDFEKTDDTYLIAMEYVQGKDLRNILKKTNGSNTIISEALTLFIVNKILEALSYAHSAKDDSGKSLDIVHRDVSPPNILISYSGEVKLTDFGVSKAANKMHQTISGALKGKLLYMSPEQAKGERNIDNRADIYSVGVILYELLTGRKLFIDNSEMAILKKVQEGIIINFNEIHEKFDHELEKILKKSLSKSLEERYQNANEMIEDINTYIANTFKPQPTTVHLSHFIYNLFKEDIVDENIKIELKPIPAVINKIEKKTPKLQPKPINNKINTAKKNVPQTTPPPPPSNLSLKPEPHVESKISSASGISSTNKNNFDLHSGFESNSVISPVPDSYSPAININLSPEEKKPVQKPNIVKPTTMSANKISTRINKPTKLDPSLEREILRATKTNKKPFMIILIAIIIIGGAYFAITSGIFTKGDKTKGPKIVSPKQISVKGNIVHLKEKKEPFSGIVESKWTNKTLKEHTEYKKGLKNGTYKKYFNNLKLKEKGSFINSNKEGLWTTYNKFGKKISETYYKSGKKNGKEILWDTKGNTISKKVYSMGTLKSGITFRFFKDSKKLKEETNYKNGKINGKKFWNINGERLIKGLIINKSRTKVLQITRRTKVYYNVSENDFPMLKDGTLGNVVSNDSGEILFTIKISNNKKNIAKVLEIKNKKRNALIEKEKVNIQFIISKNTTAKKITTANKTTKPVETVKKENTISKEEQTRRAEQKRLRDEAEKKRQAAIEKKKQEDKVKQEKEAEKEKIRLAEEEKTRKAEEAENKRIELAKAAMEEEARKRNALKEGDLVADVDTKPVVVNNKLPRLPKRLRKMMTKDTLLIVVSLLINENGNVIKVKRIKKSGIPEIDLEISSTIMNKWKFKPATKYNKKVKTWFIRRILIKK